jgi:hypothetical protein
MGTFLDLQTNIANDLTRNDLTSQIQSAINDAIKQYERSRFWFNVTRSITFTTNAGQSTYTGNDLVNIPHVIKLDKLFIVNGVSTYPLTHYEPDQFEWLTALNTANGLPTIYTYVDESIIMWPVPVTGYVIRPHMHYRLLPRPLVNDTDTNAWTGDGENLIRAHAKLILYSSVLEDDEGAQRMSNQIPGIKAMLDYETSARMATGRIRPPPGNF